MYKDQLLKFLLFLWLPFLPALMSCKEDPVSSQLEQNDEGSWLIYSPIKWSHNGNPYRSDYCIVYSDAADVELKTRVATFADHKFLEILDFFDFGNMQDLRYPPGYSKVDVYINMEHEENIAAAYWGSIFITIRSADVDLIRYSYLFKHELTHVFEFLIEGNVNLGTEIWFSEGIAIYCGGGLNGIKNIADLDRWIAKNANDPGQGNPIRIHVWDDFPPGADITGYYYNVFDLTMRYLFAEHGLGKSMQDVLNVFYAIRNGVSFPTAFYNHFGISLMDFEKEYYDRMRRYLSGTSEVKTDLISFKSENK